MYQTSLKSPYFADVCTRAAGAPGAEIRQLWINGARYTPAVDEGQAELEALCWRLYQHLSLHPVQYRHLERWVRVQRPRLLPEAIGRAVAALIAHELIEFDGWRWRAKRGGL